MVDGVFLCITYQMIGDKLKNHILRKDSKKFFIKKFVKYEKDICKSCCFQVQYRYDEKNILNGVILYEFTFD